MFDIGWTEMLVIAIVMIVVVGPKDLPKMLRTFGKTTAKLRSMAGDFQKQFNEALKEAELDEVKKSVDSLRGLNPAAEIKKQLNPFEKAAADVRAGLDSAMKPAPSKAAEPAAEAAHAAEPLKAGATSIPGVAGPEAMPTSKPVFPAMPDPTPVAAAVPEPAKAAAKPAKAVKPASKPAEPKAAAKAAQPKSASAKPVAEKKKKSAGTAS
ncbi:Sec-independent protein translocase protein TatB [Mesorhizobium sp. AaZ16]|uniref:Sec-independent protein translocase protein TatB n=1 Tax=Mesorhizobium sp. AaZ16 TaxID=3402289 RepID=UPI00374E4A94